MSGINGRCCNPSYWDNRIGGWPVDRGSTKGLKWSIEGPHYTWGSTREGVHPDPSKGRPNSKLLSPGAGFNSRLLWC